MSTLSDVTTINCRYRHHYYYYFYYFYFHYCCCRYYYCFLGTDLFPELPLLSPDPSPSWLLEAVAPEPDLCVAGECPCLVILHARLQVSPLLSLSSLVTPPFLNALTDSQLFITLSGPACPAELSGCSSFPSRSLLPTD